MSKNDKKDDKKEFDWSRLWLRIITIIGIFTFLLTLVYVIYVLREVHVSSLVNNPYCIDKTVLELTKLQGKIIDDVSITFLMTLLVTLFVSIGLFMINKYQKEFDKQKEDLKKIEKTMKQSTKKIAKEMKQSTQILTEKIKATELLFNTAYPHVISIYLISNGINDETFYSVCYQIERFIKGLTSILKQIRCVDIKNREILLYYIGNTLYNLNSYINEKNLDSAYANDTIEKIEAIKKQIEGLKVIDSDDSDKNFKLRQ